MSADPRLLALRDALPGQVLLGSAGARYHVRERVGEGGQGWVYAGRRDEPDGLVVIVKVLRPDAHTKETQARFTREADVLRRLSQKAAPNPHIVRFYDHGVAQLPSPWGGAMVSSPFTVLEHVRGPTLDHVLRQHRGRGLTPDRVQRLMQQVVWALEDVHAERIVHRDLKPSNILLAQDVGSEMAKVTDFGLVKLVDVNVQRTTALAGASLGYAPPEQYEQGNQRVTPRTDVFSFAAITYEMLSGNPAFPYRDGENPLLVVARLLNAPRPLLTKVRAGLAPVLRDRPEAIALLDEHLTRALAPDPAERHESLAALWSAIDPTLKALSEAGRSVAPPIARGAGAPAVPGGLDRTLPSATAQDRTPLAEASVPTRAPDPSAWTFRVVTSPVGPRVARAAAFLEGGRVALAVGDGGLFRWADGRWSPVGAPTGLSPAHLRGLRGLGDDGALVFGEGALAGVLRGGVYEAWSSPDPTLTFLGGLGSADGAGHLVGEGPAVGHDGTVGVLVEFARGAFARAEEVAACPRLRAVTAAGPGAVVACGDFGTVARFGTGSVEWLGSVCGGHLFDLTRLEDGSFVTVGSGGHAVGLTSAFEGRLEAVQTTRDLTCLGLTTDGAPWAGAAQGRILRRHEGQWIRMTGEMGVSSHAVALAAFGGGVRALFDDGAVVEGVLT